MNMTHDQVIEICGRMDDQRVADIIATGAGPEELIEARTWLGSDDYLGGDLGKQPAGRVGQLVEILRADEPEWDDR